LTWFRATSEEQPRLLVAAPADQTATALLPLLLEGGFRLQRVTDGRSVLEEASKFQPDLILLDEKLPDLSATDVSHALATGRMGFTAPVLLVTAQSPTAKERIGPVRAGARDWIGPWIDPDTLRELCQAHVDASREAEHGGAANLVDLTTNLYSWQGLVRRARELGALATRQHQALACLVFALKTRDDSAPRLSDAAVTCAQEAQKIVRLCDAVGRPGNSEFAVVAPATTADGAVGLAVRLAAPLRAIAANQLGRIPDQIQLHAGYEAVANFAYDPVDPATLLLRAGTALRTGAAEPQRLWLRRFADRDKA
jgi:DNA-binding response OmpR family regulator